MTVYNYTLFNNPSATTGGTQAFGINDSNQIVGYYFSNIFRGFLFAGGTFTVLNDPTAGTSSGQGTLAQGINASIASSGAEPTATWLMPVATQNRITRSCAVTFVAAGVVE
jgi:hypothetical protein